MLRVCLYPNCLPFCFGIFNIFFKRGDQFFLPVVCINVDAKPSVITHDMTRTIFFFLPAPKTLFFCVVG